MGEAARGHGRARQSRKPTIADPSGNRAKMKRQERELADASVGQVPMERLRSVFDGMFDGVWLVAADGRTTYCNGAMARLLGSTPAAMRGRPIADFLDDSLRPGFEAFLRRQRVHAGERIELRIRREDGDTLVALVAGSPITTEAGSYVGTILNVSDVTARPQSTPR